MKLKFLNTTVAGLILSLSCLVSTANAGLILSDETVVDTSGQAYSKIFDVSSFKDYINLVFTVEARGDYGTLNSENIEFLIDDISFGEFNYNTPGVNSIVGPTGNSSYDYVMDFSFTISDSDWNTLFADNSEVKIEWNNANGVDAKYASYVNFSLSGTPGEPNITDPVPVPAPTTIAVFALALIGFASRKFKKQS